MTVRTLDELMPPDVRYLRPLLGFAEADGRRRRRAALHFTDRRLAEVATATAGLRIVAEIAGPMMPQACKIAGNIHDLGADARKLGLPVLRLIGIA